MPHHVGASAFHDGSLKERTRKSRKSRGRKIQSLKDKAAYAAKQKESVTS